VSGRTLARAGVIVAGAFFVSRVLGWVRLVVITNLFGAGAQLDAYFAAFRLPDAIFQLVAAGALSSAMIPVLAGLFTKDEEQRAWRVVSTVLNVMLIVLFALSVVVAIFAPVIVPLITPGFDAVGMELTVRLTRIMLLSPILLALGAIASSVLNARGRFGAAAVAPSLYNLAIIGGALLELALDLMVATLALRVLNTESLFYVLDTFFSDFGNYPLKIFGGTVQFLLTFGLPLAFMAYFPSTVLLGRTGELNVPPALAYAAPLAGVCWFALAVCIFRHELRNYQSAGH
jgi:putative peptidoglycan lipid II flippase